MIAAYLGSEVRQRRELNDSLCRCLNVENLSVFYGSIEALRGHFAARRGRRGRHADRRERRRKVDDAADDFGLAAAEAGHDSIRRPADSGLAAARIVKSGLVQVPEGRKIFANLTVDENLQLAAFLRKDKAAIRADRERALELFPRVRERLRNRPARFRAASSRCWRSPGRSSRGRSC